MKYKKNKKSNKTSNLQSNTNPKIVLFQSLINSKYLPLIFSLLYFLILAILSFTYHKIGDYGVETDFYWSYVPAAKEFLKGVIIIDAFRGPFYQIILGIFGFIFGEYLRAGMIINLISASFVMFFTMTIIRKLFSKEYSFLVGLFLVINPIFIQYTYSAGTDMFFNALVSLAIFLLLIDKKLNYRNLILSAFITGLAYLTRYNGIFLIVFFFVIILINIWGIDLKTKTKSAIIFITTFFITISPWGIFLSIKKGSFFYNENYRNIAYELFGKGKISWDKFWYSGNDQYHSLSQVIFADPINFLAHMFQNFYNHFMLDLERLIGWQIGIFVLIGIIFFFINNPSKYLKSRKLVFLMAGGVFFLILLLVFYSERFSIFLIPFYLIMASYPFLSNKISLKKYIPKSILVMVFFIIFGLSFYKSYSFNSKRIDSGPKEILILKDWYFKHIPISEQGKTIVARKPQVGYYLNMNFNVIPFAKDYSSFIEKLRKENDDYLFFGVMEASSRPNMRGLLNPKNNFPGLKPVVYFNNPPAVLYKILK